MCQQAYPNVSAAVDNLFRFHVLNGEVTRNKQRCLRQTHEVQILALLARDTLIQNLNFFAHCAAIFVQA